ncbi:MAG: hypothetical protein HYZ45_13685 [Burkholderiales bacterium]|nr:hypothetical protein [Burkholderiales bacterium]
MMAYFFKANSRWVSIFMWAGVVSFVGYFFVAFDQGHGWGYRYFHTAWLVLPVLAAIAFEGLAQDPHARQRLYGFALASCIGSAILLVPYKAIQIESFVAESLDLIPPRVAGNARQLVFLRLECGLANDLVQNTPFFDGNELRLVSRGRMQDTQTAAALGKHPRVVQDMACAQRWLLD